MNNNTDHAKPNPVVKLKNIFKGKIDEHGTWVKQNTAILVLHGVGNQKPLETLDAFGRGLIEAYIEYGTINREDLHLSHRLVKKQDKKGEVWFDNVLRIQCKDHDHYIDLYEYFWAHYPEGKVSLPDMQRFVEATATGAESFYKDQKNLVETYGDRSVFFSEKGFQAGRYRLAIKFTTLLIPTLVWTLSTLLNLLRRIPLIGPFAYKLGEKLEATTLKLLTSVAGDVVAYNITDPKYHLYEVRKKILAGAVAALRFLLEPTQEGPYQESDWPYGKVLLAGHSLGSQIAFDAINRLDHLLSQGEIRGTDSQGRLIINGQTSDLFLNEILTGLATFGSPLDKVAFFLRERCRPEKYLRRQILANFHCFKQRNWNPGETGPDFVVESTLPRFFEEVPWRNYFDTNDPVSGSLDFYHGLTNINCSFKEGKTKKLPCWLGKIIPFTHSRYWKSREMYGDMINQLLHR